MKGLGGQSRGVEDIKFTLLYYIIYQFNLKIVQKLHQTSLFSKLIGHSWIQQGEREGDRQTDRQKLKDKQTECTKIDIEKDRDRQRQGDKHRKIETELQRDRGKDRQTNMIDGS